MSTKVNIHGFWPFYVDISNHCRHSYSQHSFSESACRLYSFWVLFLFWEVLLQVNYYKRKIGIADNHYYADFFWVIYPC